MGETVKLMPVNHEITFAIRRGVDRAFDEGHGAEAHAQEFLQEFVVIARDESDARFLAVLAEQFLNQEIVVLRPIPLAAQLPAIDEITDDVEMLAFRIAQKIEQFADLRVFGAKMNVRNPKRAVARGFGRTAI